jgi:peptide/nickel transport system permease protein
MVASFVGVSAPQFVVGLLLLYVFAVRLSWFPIGGYGTWRHLVLPSLTMGILGAGWYARMMRSSMIDVLRQDYVRTARAKGLPNYLIVGKHALANAMIPVLTIVGVIVSLLLSTAVVTETIFSIPGIGQLLTSAIFNRDYPLIQGGLLLVTIFIMIVNIVVDIAYAWVDPRVRFERPS